MIPRIREVNEVPFRMSSSQEHAFRGIISDSSRRSPLFISMLGPLSKLLWNFYALAWVLPIPCWTLPIPARISATSASNKWTSSFSAWLLADPNSKMPSALCFMLLLASHNYFFLWWFSLFCIRWLENRCMRLRCHPGICSVQGEWPNHGLSQKIAHSRGHDMPRDATFFAGYQC